MLNKWTCALVAFFIIVSSLMFPGVHAQRQHDSLEEEEVGRLSNAYEAVFSGFDKIAYTSSVSYNRQGAYDYAKHYYDKVCSDGYFWTGEGPIKLTPGSDLGGLRFGGLDCAHFVSCAIGREPSNIGGGLDINRYRAEDRNFSSYGEPAAVRLKDLLINNNLAEEVDCYTELEMGDVIIIDWEGPHGHTIFYLGDGEIATHSDSRFEYPWVKYRNKYSSGMENHWYLRIKTPVRSVTLNVSPSNLTIPGERITLTANATGVVNLDPEYKFEYRRVGSEEWTEARSYSAGNTLSLTPRIQHVGQYEFRVLARSAGCNFAFDQTDIKTHTIEKVEVEPVRSASLSVSPPSPTAPGETITFTAEADGGVYPEYQFYFKVKDAKDWLMVQSYSRDNTYSVSPNAPGSYDVGVIARSSGSNNQYDQKDTISHVVKEKDARQEGFDNNFSRSTGHQGWIGYPRDAWNLSTNDLFTRGRTGQFTSAIYSDINFANFDYSIRARRTDSASSAQYIFVRAGSEGGATSYNLYPGYIFGYANTGGYSIWKINYDGSYQPPLQGWTRTNAINRSGFNTLRVRAIGGTFQFYINGTLVNTITDHTFSRGMVGFTMARTEKDPSSTRFGIDWAKLSPITGSSAILLEDKVSPEQKALNQEVTDSGVIGSPYGDW